MTAKTARAKSPPTPDLAELFPPMRFLEKAWLTIICALLLVPSATVLWWVAGPKDPYGAVTMVYHDVPVVALIAAMVFAAVASAVGTLLMRGRLTDFGPFAAGVALTGLALRGGDLTTLLQYETGSPEARGGVFASLAVDVLLWTVVAAVAFVVGAFVEDMADLTGPSGAGAQSRPHSERAGLLRRWFERSAARTGTPTDWTSEIRQGPLATVVTAVVAIVLIRLAAGRPAAPVDHVQTGFAIALGFCLGGVVAGQFCRPALGIWFALAVPIVALVGHVGGWVSPDLGNALGSYQEIGIIAPSALARGLPVDYLSFGTAAAVLGTWTTQRVLRAREEVVEG